MNRSEASELAHRWLDTWNTHDLDAILALYSDGLEMRSPYIASAFGKSDGVLVGKAEVGKYWRMGLDRVPNLHFELAEVFLGVGSVAIRYRSSLDTFVVEVLGLGEDGLITSGHAYPLVPTGG